VEHINVTAQKTTNGALLAAISLLSASLGVTTADAGSRGGNSSARGSVHGVQTDSPAKITASTKKGGRGKQGIAPTISGKDAQ
jgi:hypothetical protein